MQVWLLFQQGMTPQHFSTVSWSLYLLIKHTCEAKSHRTADGRHPFCRSPLASVCLPTCLHQSQSLASMSLVGLAFGVLHLAVSMILLATLLQPPVMTHSTVPPHHHVSGKYWKQAWWKNQGILKQNQSHRVLIAVIVAVNKQGFNYTLHSIPSNKLELIRSETQPRRFFGNREETWMLFFIVSGLS